MSCFSCVLQPKTENAEQAVDVTPAAVAAEASAEESAAVEAAPAQVFYLNCFLS